jgi:heme O synthase-like polyprenyltransferase
VPQAAVASWRTFDDPGKRWPRAFFRSSLLYLALMCCAMVADRIIKIA